VPDLASKNEMANRPKIEKRIFEMVAIKSCGLFSANEISN